MKFYFLYQKFFYLYLFQYNKEFYLPAGMRKCSIPSASKFGWH